VTDTLVLSIFPGIDILGRGPGVRVSKNPEDWPGDLRVQEFPAAVLIPRRKDK
jgi:hypothetical protein